MGSVYVPRAKEPTCKSNDSGRHALKLGSLRNVWKNCPHDGAVKPSGRQGAHCAKNHEHEYSHKDGMPRGANRRQRCARRKNKEYEIAYGEYVYSPLKNDVFMLTKAKSICPIV